MILETNSQGSLYCTFEEKEINTYFGVTFENFIKNKRMIERFSEILIKKSGKELESELEDGKGPNITIYKITDGKYGINIERECYIEKKEKCSLGLTETEMNKMMDYVRKITS